MALTVNYKKNRNGGVDIIIYDGTKIVNRGFCPNGSDFANELARITDDLINNSNDDSIIDAVIDSNKARINNR